MSELEYEALCRRLSELRQKLDRRKKIDAMLADLREQREDLLRWEETLAETWGKEEQDVEKLEKGLTGFLASLRGGKEQRLEKERAEAYAARLRYDAKVRERQDVEQRMEALARERGRPGADRKRVCPAAGGEKEAAADPRRGNRRADCRS